jgi:recombination associated protein RdgC
MFFRNLRVYRFNRPIPWTQEELAERLEAHRFVPCQSQDAFRLGWSATAPAVDAEALTFNQGKFTLLALRREDKVLPGSVVKEAVEQRVSEIELKEQRHVGKKEKTDLKDQVTAELLPKAFSRSKLTFGYIDFNAGLLWVDTGSNTKADEFTSCLREAVGSLPVQFVELQQSPVVLFTEWVKNNQSPDNFVMGDQCELRSSDGTDTVIRCKGTESLHDAVSNHIENGMEVAELSLIWEEKLKITVNESFSIKRIKPLDLLNDKEGGKDQNAADRFMGSISLMTLEFSQLFDALALALGGEDLSKVEPST